MANFLSQIGAALNPDIIKAQQIQAYQAPQLKAVSDIVGNQDMPDIQKMSALYQLGTPIAKQVADSQYAPSVLADIQLKQGQAFNQTAQGQSTLQETPSKIAANYGAAAQSKANAGYIGAETGKVGAETAGLQQRYKMIQDAISGNTQGGNGLTPAQGYAAVFAPEAFGKVMLEGTPTEQKEKEAEITNQKEGSKSIEDNATVAQNVLDRISNIKQKISVAQNALGPIQNSTLNQLIGKYAGTKNQALLEDVQNGLNGLNADILQAKAKGIGRLDLPEVQLFKDLAGNPGSVTPQVLLNTINNLIPEQQKVVNARTALHMTGDYGLASQLADAAQKGKIDFNDKNVKNVLQPSKVKAYKAGGMTPEDILSMVGVQTPTLSGTNNNAPQAAEYPEETMAFNPKTGEKLVRKGGKWIPPKIGGNK